MIGSNDFLAGQAFEQGGGAWGLQPALQPGIVPGPARHGGPSRLHCCVDVGAADDRAVDPLQHFPERARDAGGAQRGVQPRDVNAGRSCRASRAAGEKRQRFVFGGAELCEQQRLPVGPVDAALDRASQSLAQGCKGGTTQQALDAGIWLGGWLLGRHGAGNRRSGSSSRRRARPSQVQRDTCTASMPSRRCSWAIATPGSSA